MTPSLNPQLTPILSYVEVRIVEVLPEGFEPKAGEMTVITHEGKVTGVYFLCPCGCGNDYYIPVTDKDQGEPKKETHWHFSKGLNGPTLEPSVRHLGGCKAHFNITDGKTIVHEDSGK